MRSHLHHKIKFMFCKLIIRGPVSSTDPTRNIIVYYHPVTPIEVLVVPKSSKSDTLLAFRCVNMRNVGIPQTAKNEAYGVLQG